MSREPLWQDDEVLSDGLDGLSAKLGGTYPYLITSSLIDPKPDIIRNHRLQITRYIMSYGSKDAVCVINTDNINQAIRTPTPSFLRRADILVSEMAKLLGRSLYTQYQFSLSDQDRVTNDLCRTTSTPNARELRGLILYARDRGFLASKDGTINGMYKVRITADGVIHSEDDVSGFNASRNAFIAMWFNPEVDAAYRDGISPAIIELGYEPVRIDNKEHSNKIDDEIIYEIRKSKFVVADFSCGSDGVRGGVYFETGYALALGRPVIWTVRSADIGRVHFDTRQFNHIVWSDPEDLRVKLVRRIGAIIGPYEGPA